MNTLGYGGPHRTDRRDQCASPDASVHPVWRSTNTHVPCHHRAPERASMPPVGPRCELSSRLAAKGNSWQWTPPQRPDGPTSRACPCHPRPDSSEPPRHRRVVLTHHAQPRSVHEYPLAVQGVGPYNLTADTDGSLWATFVHHGQIARLTRDGSATLYTLDSAACGPSIITVGPDRALWFTRLHDNRIGRITSDGRADSFTLPTPDSRPFGITPGTRGFVVHRDEHRPCRTRHHGWEITEFPLPTRGGFHSSHQVRRSPLPHPQLPMPSVA